MLQPTAVLPAILLCLLALPAPAVLIDSGDGTGNTTAPSPNSGWDHIGLRGALSAVYVGNSYVLTANHVGVGSVLLGGVTYQAVPGTEVRLANSDGSLTDLLLFSIFPVPALPLLPIAATPPTAGEDLILAGNGRNRGDPTSFDPNGPPPPPGLGGYLWLPSRTLRWGTNQVDSFITLDIAGMTESLTTVFESGASLHESSAATGDSGGAVFRDIGSEWELAGIMLAISVFSGQDPQATIYGNETHAADLSFYRDDILAVISLPEPGSGLPFGIAYLAGLSWRRRER